MPVITPLRKKKDLTLSGPVKIPTQICIRRAIGYPRSMRMMLPMECMGIMQNTLKVLEEDHRQHRKNIEELKMQITELKVQNMEHNIRMKDLE